MKAKIYSFGILASLALATLAFGADGFTIGQKPKKDEVHKYTMKGDIDLNGMPVQLTGAYTEKTTDVAADGSFTIEHAQTELKINLNGNEIDNPAGPAVSTVYKPSGEVSKIVGDSTSIATAGAYRMSNLTVLFDPGKAVNVGDAWSHDFAADSTTGAVKAHADYKLLGEEKIGNYNTLKIQATIKEASGDPAASSDGTIWIDKADGSLVKGQMKWVAVPIPGAPGPVNATMELNRVG